MDAATIKIKMEDVNNNVLTTKTEEVLISGTVKDTVPSGAVNMNIGVTLEIGGTTVNCTNWFYNSSNDLISTFSTVISNNGSTTFTIPSNSARVECVIS